MNTLSRSSQPPDTIRAAPRTNSDTDLDALVGAPYQDGGHDNVDHYWHDERGRRP